MVRNATGVLAAFLLMLGGAACSPEAQVEDVNVETGQENDVDNQPDPESEDVSDIEDAGDPESSEEESSLEEDDIEPEA